MARTPGFVAAASNSADLVLGTTTLLVNVPAGTQDNDFMLGLIVSQKASADTFPAGWTLLPSGSFSLIRAAATGVTLAYRIANSEPANYTFGAVNNLGIVAILDYNLVWGINPPANQLQQSLAAAPPLSSNLPNIANTILNQILLYVYAVDNFGNVAEVGLSPDLTADAAVTSRLNVRAAAAGREGVSLLVADEPLLSGNLPSRTFTAARHAGDTSTGTFGDSFIRIQNAKNVDAGIGGGVYGSIPTWAQHHWAT